MSTGEPVHQLRGFQRVDLQPGESKAVHFTVSAHDLAHWASGGWTTTPGTYQILVGGSSRDLPLSGSLNVTSTLRAAASVTVANPRGMSTPVHARTSLPITAHTASGGKLTYTATGLPAGLSIDRDGVISGSATHAGTSTVTVTATDGSGATGTATFVWTTTRSRPK